MKRIYFGFIAIAVLALVLKASGETRNELSEEEYYEDYDSAENDTSTIDDEDLVISPTTAKISTEKGIKIKQLPVELVLHTTTPKVMKCPRNCKCSDGFYLVDCSHRNLKQMPKDLPYSTVQLNLSYNSLTKFDVKDLAKCTDLRQIFLQNNRIETIVNPQKFTNLPYLHHIDLSTNALKPLRGDEFSHAQSLAALFLTNNKDVVPQNVPVVQAPKLKTLNLSNCNIQNFSDNTFQNLSSLVALFLDSNPLDLTKCIGAFKYLINLRTLSIPTVARDKALDLCANLEAIDIIHLSLETHEISCFLLTSGSTYEESMIQTNLYKVPTDAPLTTTTITTVGNLLKPAQSLMEDKIVLKNTKTGTTYDRMCMVYMVISGLVVLLIAAILIAFCIIGSSRYGREIMYKKQCYKKYYPQNLTVENQNYEAHLMESERKI